MSFKESMNDLLSPESPDLPSMPWTDFDLMPATLEDDPAMQAVLASLRESSEISRRSLEVTESARDIARSSRNVARSSFIAIPPSPQPT